MLRMRKRRPLTRSSLTKSIDQRSLSEFATDASLGHRPSGEQSAEGAILKTLVRSTIYSRISAFDLPKSRENHGCREDDKVDYDNSVSDTQLLRSSIRLHSQVSLDYVFVPIAFNEQKPI
jgi:hypothetical protein